LFTNNKQLSLEFGEVVIMLSASHQRLHPQLSQQQWHMSRQRMPPLRQSAAALQSAKTAGLSLLFSVLMYVAAAE
jgi:hypothetical protein